MPKRDGIDVVLWPPDFPMRKGFVDAWLLYGHYQGLDSRKDIEREKNIIFRVGPKEWKKLEDWCRRSRPTIKRWQKKLIESGWVSVEPQSDGSELVTLHSERVKLKCQLNCKLNSF